jgi:ParB family transcriptional regulator, chromosome partitioning protein
MERRLGRGLETLLGGSAGAGPVLQPVGQGPADSGSPRANLPIQDVRPNPDQPRKVFDSGALEELRDSIQRHGIIQPICVRRRDKGYEIVAGERRWRAARLAGLAEIPATVLENAEDDRLLELALVENLQRQDLDPLEKAAAFKSMMSALDLTQADVADRVGMKRATVANHVRLLELPVEAQEAVVAGLISMGHAKALLALGDANAIRAAMAQTVRDELSVRALEKLVKIALSGAEGTAPGEVASGPQGGRIPAWVRDLEGRMRDGLGTRVSIQNRPGYKGQIVIRYHDRDELDRLCQVLAPKDELA